MLNEYISSQKLTTEKRYFKLSGCRYISKDEYVKIMQPTELTQLRVNNQYWLEKRDEIFDYAVRTVALVFVCLFFIFICPKLCTQAYERHVYYECLEESQKYIDSMKYEKAIDVLEKGLRLKTRDTSKIVTQIGYLYACLDRYDEGIELLTKEYEISNNASIYTRLEELKKDKSIDEYNKYISIADDANHSITEDDRLDAYTKAIDAKPDESRAYILVSNIYLSKMEYDKAINILASGVEVCEKISGEVARNTSSILKSEINKIDKIINNTDYNKKYLEVCDAYKKNDLNRAILNYKEAKKINYRDYRLYIVMSNTYTNNNKYDEAIAILNEGIKVLRVYKNNSLMVGKYKLLIDCRNKVGTIKKYVNNYNSYYKKIYNACVKMAKENKVTELEKILTSKTYATMASSSNVTCYNSLGKFVDKMGNGTGMAVYKNQYLYYGSWKNGKRHGVGYYIASNKSGENIITYIYAGKWENGYPNGKGTVSYTITKKKSIIYRTITTGNFKNGYEHGKLHIKKYDKNNYGNKTVYLNYTAKNGVLQYLKDKNGKILKTSTGDMIIGYYYVGNKKSEVVATNKTLVWKVNGLGL